MSVGSLMSKYETMRTDPANWKLGIVYCCNDDPRIVVRNLLPFGWTWNFGHQKAYIAILVAIASLLAPPFMAWQMGVRSALAIGIIITVAFIAVVLVASRLARDPDA